MKTKIFKFSFIFFILGWTHFIYGTPSLKVIGPEEIDFGKFDKHVEKKANFTIKNIGSSNLIINRITKSCGCASANILKKDIASDESTTITVTFKGNDTTLGPFIKSIFVHSNDPKKKMTKLNIWGYVNPK